MGYVFKNNEEKIAFRDFLANKYSLTQDLTTERFLRGYEYIADDFTVTDCDDYDTVDYGDTIDEEFVISISLDEELRFKTIEERDAKWKEIVDEEYLKFIKQ